MSELVPVGYYNAVAVPVDTDSGRLWAQFGETSKGTKQVVLHFEILDGPQAGRRLPWFGFFTADSTDRTIEALRLAGFKGDDLAQLPWMQLEQKVSVTVEHSTWEGKTRAKIAWVNKPGGGGMKLEKPLDQNSMRMFAAALKSKVAAKGEIAGEKATPGATPQPAANGASAPAAEGDPNDGLPF